MSNNDLRAEVSRLRSQLAEIQRENARLDEEIRQGISGVNDANHRINALLDRTVNDLNKSAENLTQASSYGDEAVHIQMEIETLYPLLKNMEDANKKIRELNNKVYYDFSTYRTVRRIMQGCMDNLDLFLVNDELIYKAVEKSQLQTSDYWLTGAMLAIMAWKNDQREMADRAIKEAFRLDKKNTIIFFMIFNLRMGRDETALHWFMEFEKCEMTGEDKTIFLMMFSLISRTITENVSPEVNNRITAFIRRIIHKSKEAEGYSEEELTNRIAGKLLTMQKTGIYNAPALAASMNGYDDFTATLDMAANNYNILDKLASIINVPVSERNMFLKEFMDRLIAKPNAIEKEIYDQIEFYESVIRNSGEVAAAEEEIRSGRKEAEAQIPLVSYMVNWIGDIANDSINGQMRLSMFKLITDCEQKGVQKYAENYRVRYKEVWPITIGDYSSSCNFQDEETEKSKIRFFYKNLLDEHLSQINNNAAYLILAIAVLVLGGGIYLKFIIPAIAGGALFAAFGGILILFNKRKRYNLTTDAEKKTENTILRLHDLFREFDGLRQKYYEFDGVQEDIIDLFAQI